MCDGSCFRSGRRGSCMRAAAARRAVVEPAELVLSGRSLVSTYAALTARVAGRSVATADQRSTAGVAALVSAPTSDRHHGVLGRGHDGEGRKDGDRAANVRVAGKPGAARAFTQAGAGDCGSQQGSVLHAQPPGYLRVQTVPHHSHQRGQLPGTHSGQAPPAEHCAPPRQGRF